VGQRERLPRSPTGRRHGADLAQRKLSRLASSSPLPLTRARRDGFCDRANRYR
jgi:hypothetical protein